VSAGDGAVGGSVSAWYEYASSFETTPERRQVIALSALMFSLARCGRKIAGPSC